MINQGSDRNSCENIVKNIDKENRSYSRSNVRLLGRPEGLDHISTERRQSVRVFYRGGEGVVSKGGYEQKFRRDGVSAESPHGEHLRIAVHPWHR